MSLVMTRRLVKQQYFLNSTVGFAGRPAPSEAGYIANKNNGSNTIEPQNFQQMTTDKIDNFNVKVCTDQYSDLYKIFYCHRKPGFISCWIHEKKSPFCKLDTEGAFCFILVICFLGYKSSTKSSFGTLIHRHASRIWRDRQDDKSILLTANCLLPTFS